MSASASTKWAPNLRTWGVQLNDVESVMSRSNLRFLTHLFISVDSNDSQPEYIAQFRELWWNCNCVRKRRFQRICRHFWLACHRRKILRIEVPCLRVLSVVIKLLPSELKRLSPNADMEICCSTEPEIASNLPDPLERAWIGSKETTWVLPFLFDRMSQISISGRKFPL